MLTKIKTKARRTPYVNVRAEEFYAKVLTTYDEECLALSKHDHIHVIDLSGDAPRVRLLPLAWIDTIDGKPITAPQTEWQVSGSKGNTYTVKWAGNKYTCTCKGFMYRKHCKHVKEIADAN